VIHYHVDGELVPAGEASLGVDDRGFRYGDAARETLRAYGGSVHRWDAHRRRVERTCESLSIPVPDDLRERVRATLSASDLDDALLELVVTRGEGGDGPTPPDPAATDPTVVVTCESAPRGGRKGSHTWDDPAAVRVSRYRRPPAESLPPELKTASYLSPVLARLELDGEDEALVRDTGGAVVGGAASNAFFVDGDGLHAPDPGACPAFPGVVRQVVLDRARERGIPVTLGRYVPRDFRRADEAFLTNTAWEVRPVGTVDGVPVGGGPVTDLLRTAFANRIEAEFY